MSGGRFKSTLPVLLLYATGLIALGVPAPAFAAPRTSCASRLGEWVRSYDRDLNSRYLQLSPKSGGIRPGNGSVFLPGGADRLTVLVHGFNGSPFEVSSLAQAIHATGESILAPLVPGFGSTSEVANQFVAQDWQTAIASVVDAASSCYADIRLVGFSLGGALVSDFVLRHPDGSLGARAKITSVIEVSPYFANHSMLESLLDWADSHFFGEVSVSFLYEMSGDADLKALLDNPRYYNQGIPLESAQQVILFGKQVRKLGPGLVTGIPLRLVLSDSDQTIDAGVAASFIGEHFQQVTTYTYPASDQIPHQILVPSANPRLDSLLDWLTRPS